MTMQFNDDQLRTIVAKSIFDSMPDEKKEEMMTKALTALMTSTKDPYSSRRTPSDLENAFVSQLHHHVRAIVKEWMEKPENKARIHTVVTKALDDAINSDNLQAALAEGIRAAFIIRDR